MSLYIDVEKVTAVLIAGQWYPVVGNSFGLDSYEFHYGDQVVHRGGQSDVCATGFAFQTDDRSTEWISGPLTAIQAVKSS